MIRTKFYIQEIKNTISPLVDTAVDGTKTQTQAVTTDLILLQVDDKDKTATSGTVKITFTDFKAAQYFQPDQQYYVDFTLAS